MKKIILASNSPRRKELLKNLGVKFDIMASDVDEDFNPNLTPTEVVLELAARKAKWVASKVEEDAIVIGADTIVVKKNILGKPKNAEEAFKMLKALEGSAHEVITGIAIVDTTNNKIITDYITTAVYFRPMTEEEINQYIATQEPMDKAGAYGIQGKAALFVERIEGDYFNVVGLPIYKLGEILQKEYDISLLK